MKIFTMLAAVLIWTAPAVLQAETRVIHVLVALCDNEHQGIVPVPAHLGNGDDPAGNLYWGALYGVSTHLKKHPGWTLEAKYAGLSEYLLERLVFRSKADPEVWLVADAYAGRHIQKCTEDFFDFAAGLARVEVSGLGPGRVAETPAEPDRPSDPKFIMGDERQVLYAGGRADLLVYMGHNGLMDFTLPYYPSMPFDDRQRQAAVFSCVSETFFKDRLLTAGAEPLMTTRQLMAPEAYILAALAEGWIKNESPAQLHERVAQAYHKYQKCGIKAARNTFAVPGDE